VLQLGMVALPKTANPKRMRENASVDFEIAPEDVDALNAAGGLADYGASSFFPVFGGKL
jgi:diketogulonate reductase-like aldo/keto reductase